MVAVWIGWIEVGRLTLRFAEVSVGIGRGKIVDCGGSLARFRLDEWGMVWGNRRRKRKRTRDYS